MSDAALCDAVAEMSQGLVDADLCGGVVKKRVALPGRGKRGGARTLVATNRSDRWFFLFGFAKNERDTISADELEALQCLSADLLSLSPGGLDGEVEAGALQEICNETKAEGKEPDPRGRTRNRP